MIEKIYFNVREASEYLGLKTSNLYQMTMKKQIRFYKVGNLLRFKKTDLDEYMESLCVEPSEEVIYDNDKNTNC